MRRLVAAVWITLVALSLSDAGAKSGPEERRILRVGWNSMEPFQYIDGSDHLARLTGIDIELLREALHRTGCQAHFIELSRTQQLEQLADGTLDVALASARYTDYSSFGYVSVPMRRSQVVIVIPEENQLAALAEDPDRLFEGMTQSGHRVAAVKGRRSTHELERRLGYHREAILVTGSETESFQALSRGEVDAVAAERLAAAAIAAHRSWQDRPIVTTTPFSSGDFNAIFSRRSVPEPLVLRFNQAMIEMEKDGTRARILQRFSWAVMLASMHSVTGTTWFMLVNLAGTIAFALSGILLGRRDGYSLFGALVLALLPAVGGGTLRDLLIGRQPLNIIENPSDILIVIATVLAGFLFYKLRDRLTSPRLAWVEKKKIIRRSNLLAGELYHFSDALGLAAFTIVGIVACVEARIIPLWLWGPALAALTAAGGGILRDALRADDNNTALKGTFYAEISLIWGYGLSLFLHLQNPPDDPQIIATAMLVTLAGVLTTRLALLHYGISSPLMKRRRKN